jgi:hypothetical protein
MRNFKLKFFSESSPELGGWGAEAIHNKAKNLHRTNVVLKFSELAAWEAEDSNTAAKNLELT